MQDVDQAAHRLERITAICAAIGLSTRIGSALPASSTAPSASLDEAEIDGLLIVQRGQRRAA
jgi:hypothetical protein